MTLSLDFNSYFVYDKKQTIVLMKLLTVLHKQFYRKQSIN